MVYQWKAGARIKTPADVAAEVMNELAAKNELNAQALVDVSRPEDAPLHQDFEWDDLIAAEEWRKSQARNIIRSLVVKEEEVQDSEPVRMYFQISEGTSNYTPMDVILRSSDSMEALREQALKELIAYKKKYAVILKKLDAESEISQLQMKMELGA